MNTDHLYIQVVSSERTRGITRREPPQAIQRLNWESSALLAHAAAILVEEALGVQVAFTDAAC